MRAKKGVKPKEGEASRGGDASPVVGFLERPRRERVEASQWAAPRACGSGKASLSGARLRGQGARLCCLGVRLLAWVGRGSARGRARRPLA